MSIAVVALAGALAAPAWAKSAPADPDPPASSPADDAPLFAPAPDTRAAPSAAGAAPMVSAQQDESVRDEAMGDQAISAAMGFAKGGHVTPGGLRIVGHYLYQLSDRDWFDGSAAFTFGSGEADCFRDRGDMVVCDHGSADGTGVELMARVRRLLAPRSLFHPFATAGVGIGLARFSDDDVSGVTFPLHVGGGLRVNVARSVAVVFEDELALGIGVFGRGLGVERQISFTVTLGAEFRLQ